MTANSTGYTVLVVEDNPDHVVLVEAVFAHKDPNADLQVAWSAEEAIEYLSGRAPVPAVIVLDINMPGIGGLGFLEWYGKQSRAMRDIPVVVFTSSANPQIARLCYAMGAREFKEKPADFRELVDIVHGVLDYWRSYYQEDSGS